MEEGSCVGYAEDEVEGGVGFDEERLRDFDPPNRYENMVEPSRVGEAEVEKESKGERWRVEGERDDAETSAETHEDQVSVTFARFARFALRVEMVGDCRSCRSLVHRERIRAGSSEVLQLIVTNWITCVSCPRALPSLLCVRPSIRAMYSRDLLERRRAPALRARRSRARFSSVPSSSSTTLTG